ncbi:unnamed protein product [Lactuca virosa]|uniref:Enhancer of polycomb-like protein n=1 Tax=Lactuca virosa TaxID=75947 RepID=A0AAU9NK04_9ASTR|nr:unnamed protein product [Lactuca virosa]
MGSAGMKRSARVSGDTIIRSGRRLVAKRMRLTSMAVVDTQENKVELLDQEKHEREIKLGESTKHINGTDQVNGIDHEEPREIKENGHRTDEQEDEIKLEESKKTSLVDDNRDDGDKVSRTKQFGAVYTRKRKRTIPCDSCLKSSSLEEKCGSDKMFKNKYFKKRVRTNLVSGIFNLNLGSNVKDVLWKGPVIFSRGDNSSSRSNGFSCSVSSVLRYMRNVKVFSWRQFSSFLLSELTLSIYSSIGIRFSQDTMGHGFLKVFGSVLSIPLFTVDFISLPFCFLYMHSSLLLKFAFLSYALILHPVVENAMDDDIKVPSVFTELHHFGKYMLVTKRRSSRKRVPRVSLFKKGQTHVDNIVPVPGVREVAGYEQEEYVPFKLPDLYISSKSDEVSRTLQKSYPIYDMDSADEKWLKKFNSEQFANECVSEDTFEKVIDAFERGIYCSPDDYSNATSAVDRCLELASKDVLEALYRYWMTKRKKKRSPLLRVFQCYPRRRVRKHATNTVLRKKRSLRKRKSQLHAGKPAGFLKAMMMMNEQKTLEEAADVYMKVHETQEDVRRSEMTAIVKRQEAQALMETADLATYRATMALRIAEARAATTGFSL